MAAKDENAVLSDQGLAQFAGPAHSICLMGDAPNSPSSIRREALERAVASSQVNTGEERIIERAKRFETYLRGPDRENDTAG